MKTDRELLELAAKAAGINGFFCERTPEDGYPSYTCGITSGHQLIFWNPLTDDGDALRLAMKLKMSVDVLDRRAMARAYFRKDNLFGSTYADEKNADIAIATRRSIVKVAAAIGESMP